MLKELNEDLNSIKRIQSETKDALIEIKNNLQGNNSRVEEAENQINDLEHKEAKKQAISTRRKKNPKKKKEREREREQYKQPLGQLQVFHHSHHKGVRRRRERARNWKST